jgi:putative hydrolase
LNSKDIGEELVLRLENIKEAFNKILSERYLFHIHTNYTDGKLTVEDYFNFAQANGIKTLVFTEHVRINLDYSFDLFINEVTTVSEKYQSVNFVIGAEAKILPDMTLDISGEVYDKIDLLAIACHRFPNDTDLYFNSLMKIFEQKRNIPAVFVHPGRYFKKRYINDQNYRFQNLIDFATLNGVYIENNKRENLPNENISIPKKNEVIGFDVHGYSELNLFKSFIQS